MGCPARPAARQRGRRAATGVITITQLAPGCRRDSSDALNSASRRRRCAAESASAAPFTGSSTISRFAPKPVVPRKDSTGQHSAAAALPTRQRRQLTCPAPVDQPSGSPCSVISRRASRLSAPRPACRRRLLTMIELSGSRMSANTGATTEVSRLLPRPRRATDDHAPVGVADGRSQHVADEPDRRA